MKALKNSILVYFLGLILFLGSAWTFIFLFDRPKQVEIINLNHSLWADYLFRFLTALAEVMPIFLTAVFFAVKNKVLLKPFIASYALSTLLIQGLKHLVFADSLRPFAYFGNQGAGWHLVPGVFMNEFNSMPSGHTSAAWFLFFWISFHFNTKAVSVLCAFLAMGVAYSRVYLFQHFPIDTVIGALIGFSSSWVIYYFMIFKKGVSHDFKN